MTSCIKQVDWFLAGDIGEYIGNNFVNNDGNTFRNGVQELGQRSRDQLKHCAISVHWPRKFTDSEISEYEYFFNIHPGFLPIGRGMYPVFWAIFLDDIAGVTCHQITNVLDSGPILFREKVPYQSFETYRQVSKRIFEKEIDVFMSTMFCASKFSHDLKLFEPQYPLGKNQKKTDVQILFRQAIEGTLSDSQLFRLMLAVSDDRIAVPDVVKKMLKDRFYCFPKLRKCQQ